MGLTIPGSAQRLVWHAGGVGFRVWFVGVVVGVGVWTVWLAWQWHVLGFLPDHEVVDDAGNLLFVPGTNSWYDAESGIRVRVGSPGAYAVVFPLVAMTYVGFLMVVVKGHWADIRVGWRRWRERPLRVGLGTAVFAASIFLCVPILYALDAPRGMTLGRYVEFLFLLYGPIVWTIFGALCAWVVLIGLIGPWQMDAAARFVWVVRLLGRLERSRRLEDAERRGVVRAELAWFEEVVAARPYRGQVLASVLFRLAVVDEEDAGALDESILRIIALIPSLDEPGWPHVFLPTLFGLDARVQFVRTLLNTHWRTGARPHLDVAIRILDGIHRRPPVTTSRRRRATIALVLAHALWQRGASGDLERAHILVDRAARVAPDEATTMRAKLLVWGGHETGRDAVVDEAIEALRANREDDLTLANLLVRRFFRRRDDPGDLHDAVALTRGLLAAPGEDNPEVLGTLLLAHSSLLDLDVGLAVGQLGPEVVDALDRVDALAVPPWPVAQLAERLKGLSALTTGDVDAGVDHFEEALRLAVGAASLALSRTDRQEVFQESVVGPSDAAAVALLGGRVERAVELLELGRTVIWWQVRELRRSGVADELRAVLERPNYPAPDTSDVLAAHKHATSRDELAREWDEQRQPTRRRTSFAELRQSARGGPVVFVNTSYVSCDAIIVLADRAPVHVPLPDLTESDAATWAEGLLDADARRMNARAIAPRLWDAVAAPVLAAVEPHLGRDRRIWWCTTGALTPVPLHMAGRDGHTVLDEVVSSYTPNLWSLLDTPKTEVPVQPAMVITSLRDTAPRPDGTRWPALPHAEDEAELISARVPTATRLAEQDATVAAVKAALSGNSLAHFACHGDLRGLVLHDGSLGLDELAGMDLAGNELAFLSACVTALPDSRNLDEALHPAAALHLQGFSHVIGTLWHLRSEDGPAVADEFYAHLLGGCPPALALHRAQRRLKESAPNDPARWAPFIHIGP